MTAAHAYLVLGTYHAQRLHATQLAPLDGERLLAVVEHAAQIGHDDLLTGHHVRCAAHNLLRFALAQIHRRHMKMVAVGVRLAREHLPDVEPLQPALDGLHFFQAPDFQSDGSQRFCRLLRREVEVDVFLKPFIRNVHSLMLCCFQNGANIQRKAHIRKGRDRKRGHKTTCSHTM